MPLKTKPLVTIITITFNLIKNNRENFFRQCLESVHDQLYDNIEHIIIDGASKDGTLDLIEEYANNEWVSYISEPDTGIYDAMNKGIKLAQGKYVAFLNSDDYYHSKNAIASSVDALEKSGADFSYAPLLMINEDGTSLHYKHPHCSPIIQNVFFTMPFCHQTMFTKKDVLLKENLFNINFKNAGDYDLVLRLCLKKYKNILVKDSFATFRFGGFSDIANRQSVKEVALSYYNNYSKLCPITKKECEKIYCHGYSNIPVALAEKLKDFKPYFSYDEYLDCRKLKNKLLNKFTLFFHKIQTECKFAVLYPKKFANKYLKLLKNIVFKIKF